MSDIFTQRSVYRELFNEICADFFHYRLNNKTDTDFEKIEKKIWKYRENALSMQPEDVEDYVQNLLSSARLLTSGFLFRYDGFLFRRFVFITHKLPPLTNEKFM